MFSIPLFSSNLSTNKIGHQIEYLKSVDSTNIEIYRMFQNHSIQFGDLVFAEQQISGRGRRDNVWYSKPGKSITFSIILKNNEPDILQKLPLLTGISIIRGIKQLTNIECKLKWPNDILYNSKKIGGVLIENKGDCLIIGVGLNVNENELEESIQKTTLSLKLITNRIIKRELLLAFIVNHFESLMKQNLKSIIKEWEYSCAHLDTAINFHQSGKRINAKFLGLNQYGQATLEIGTEKKTITSGIIEL